MLDCLRVKYIFLMIIFLLLAGSGAYASENITQPLVKNSTITTKTGISIPKGAAQVTSSENKIETPPLTNVSVNTSKPKNIALGDLIFRMLKGLAGILLLIALIAGGVVLYRKLSGKIIKKPKSFEQESTAHEENEPQNISEAVASFVKHRIKKK